MSVLAQGSSEPVADFDALVEYIAAGCKPAADSRIGTEHEKFGFFQEDFSPIPHAGERSISAILSGLQRFGWQPLHEDGQIIGLQRPAADGADGGNISLEPGGQFELSGAPLRSVHETCAEIDNHFAEVRAVADGLGIGFLGLGFAPHWRLDEIPVMPKQRYHIIARYMQQLGSMGLDMMFRTCTVQVNLDFSSEADMVRKLRVSLALQPLAAAIFANSPFREGKPSGLLSYRSHMWLDTDPQRAGMLDLAFEPGFGFAAYARYALDVPLYFVHRDGRYVDVAGRSFRDFLAGRLPGLEGERPSEIDWANHLTTIFPEARLKRFIEMRGADAGPQRLLCALPAFWVGLLYHQPSLDAAWELVSQWSTEERNRLRAQVPAEGLSGQFRGEPLLDWAWRFLELSRTGLQARGLLDADGNDETRFLQPVEEILSTGRTPAEELLARFHGAWQGDVTRIFSECAY